MPDFALKWLKFQVTINKMAVFLNLVPDAPCVNWDVRCIVSRWLDKLEFKCKSRGMETCLHSRGAALNARETGI